MESLVRRRTLCVAIAALFAVGGVHAQNTSSSMSGRVLDASGAPVVGSSVKIVHVPSGTTREVTTDADGRYRAQGLRLGGPFEVIATTPSGTAERDGVYLQLAQDTNLDLSLATPASTATNLENVQVHANASDVAMAQTFNADNKGMGVRVSRQQLDVLPVPNRSIQDIARLNPTINITNKSKGEISALGQNSRYNNITIDSVPTNDSFGLEDNGLPALNQPVSLDAIEAYNISTANYDVANKRAVGANINIVTKSGTNDFHGSTYYVYRNASNMVGDDRAGNEFKGYTRQWTAGATFGGPIIKDKLFFFASLEKSKTVAAAPNFGPLGSGKGNIVPISQADIDRISSIASRLGMNPGTATASGANQEEKRGLFKIDWNIADGHRVSLRYDKTKSEQPNLNGYSTSSTSPSLSLSSYWFTKHREDSQWVLNAYDEWNDSFSTEGSFSYSKYDASPTVATRQPQVRVYTNGTITGNTITGPSVNLGEEEFRHYNILGIRSYNGFFAGTWNVGDHSIKAGVDYQRDEFYNLFGRTEFGAYVFPSIDAFANRNYFSYSVYRPTDGDLSSIAAKWDLTQWGFFAQDTWQLGNLSLQYGLRYDLPKVSNSPMANPVFNAAFPGYPNNATIDGNGVLEPRASFNYAFDTERATQLRGGIGLSEGAPPGVWLSNPYTNNGLSLTSYSASNGTGFSADPSNPLIPSNVRKGGSPEVDVTDRNFKMPTVWKASLGFDHQLPWSNLVLTAEVEHLETKNAVRFQDLNLGAATGALPDGRQSYWTTTDPAAFRTVGKSASGQAICATQSGICASPRANRDPRFGNVIYLSNTSQGQATYGTLQLSKPFTSDSDWSGSLGFVFGSSKDVSSGNEKVAASTWANDAVFNPNADATGHSNFEIQRRIIASLSWQHRFFGDYNTSISAFYDGHTGQPYSWVFGNDVSGIAATGTSSPLGLAYIPKPGEVLFQQGTKQAVIDQFYSYIGRDSYLKDRQGHVAQRNAAHSPWVNEVDLSIRQEIPGLFKGNKGELRLDIFNVTNLINKRWGQVRDIGYPYMRSLANFAGVDPTTGKYVYALPVDARGNYNPGTYVTEDDRAQSRWSLQLTARYTF
ncbi:TonB-dependent receptor [Rothia nasimurium]|uniref:TonB-dependent receptor n=1 Tax=Luteibacter anthropi TaxID=564369 RepID=A0A7X5UDJ4_9GAMM|nr:TonB-dependent receptor [Luteibacter anthropi]NII08282.1 TonB-dependent receptor [Luteibacter anthropi]